MKLLIIILVLLSFIQTTILPLDLVLVILLLRSYIKPERTNLTLAFFLGILIAQLMSQPPGLYCTLYLILVELTSILASLPLRKNLIFAGASLIVFLLLEKIVLAKFTGATPYFWSVVFEMVFALLSYFVLKLWEERFVVRSEIKLRL